MSLPMKEKKQDLITQLFALTNNALMSTHTLLSATPNVPHTQAGFLHSFGAFLTNKPGFIGSG